MEIHEAQTEPVCEMHQGSQRLNAPVTDPDHAWGIWGRKASGVLLVCGRGIDALDVPFRVIELLLALADADLTVPVATAPAPSRWVLFVATGSGTL
ncbi:MAG: hypothetical protein ACRDRI_11185, partial [Pseudonocardiaceae bacterium]